MKTVRPFALVAVAALTVACGEAVEPGLPQGAQAPEAQAALSFDAQGRVETVGFDAPSNRAVAALPGLSVVAERVGTPAFNFKAPAEAAPERGEQGTVEVVGDEVNPVDTRRLEQGDVCTVNAQAWGEACSRSDSAACALKGYWGEVADANGELRVGATKAVIFTSADAVAAALPADAPAEALSSDVVDPSSTELDALGAELVALSLNLRFSEQRLAGSFPLASAVVTQGLFYGWRVDEIFAHAQHLYGAEVSGSATAQLDTLTQALRSINNAAPDCAAPAWMRR